MALGPQFRRPTLLVATLALLATGGASPARADRCDDIANELKNQIDGLNLSSSDRSTVAQLVAEISGLRTTVNQAVLGMEADRQSMREDLDALTVLLQSHIGVA